MAGRKPRGRVIRQGRSKIIDEVRVSFPRYYFPPKLLRSCYGWFYWLSVRGTVRRLMRSHPPDAAIGYWAHPDGEAAVRAGREMGIPSVVIAGGSDVLLLTEQKSRGRCVRKVLDAADLVVAVSSDLRKKIIDLGVSPEKVQVWNRGIDSTHFSPGDRVAARRRLGIPTTGGRLVWVGRMVPVKGLDVLLEACAILQQRQVDFHLYLVGDGPLRKSLEDECRFRSLHSRVTFVGNRLHDELPDWYRAADCTVLPSRSEGLPNVLRESLACGTPFVASDVGGVCEIADETSSIVVPADDPDALAQAIVQGFSTWGSHPLMDYSSRFLTWSESAASLVRILRSAISAFRKDFSRREESPHEPLVQA